MIDGLVSKIHGFDCMQMGEVAAMLVINAPLTQTPMVFSLAISPGVGDIVRALAKRIRVRGDANYCVCRILLEGMKPETGWCYHSLSDVLIAFEAATNFVYDVQREQELEDAATAPALSVLYDAITEIERRLIGPYEDKAILKNGDMACFDEPFAYKPQDTCGCKGDTCGCPPEGKPILDNFHLKALQCGVRPVPAINVFTQEQCDAIDKERKANE